MRILSFIYIFIINIRNLLFDRGVLKAKAFDPVVISVGNLLAGGTGKTPIVHFLLHLFKKKSFKVGVISRGYRGHFKGVREVNPQEIKRGAFIFGDEPFWLALNHRDSPIFVGRDRRKVLKALVKKHAVDLVVADDAFQHRFIKRDFDLVLIDALAKFYEYRGLPQGRAREPMSSLKRAHVILLNRVNLVSKEKKEQLISKIEEHFFCETINEKGQKLPIIEVQCFIRSLRRFSDHEEIKHWKGKKIFLASGVGKPSSFFKMMEEQSSFILGHRVFKDHYSYTLKDVENLIYESKSLKADFIVITEKDAVKFLSFREEATFDASFFYVAQMSLEMSENILELEEKILERLKEKKSKIKVKTL